MGFFGKSKKPDETPRPAGEAKKPPALDLEGAASKIEACTRGKLARKQTSSMKAHREREAETPIAAALAKCLPCLK